MDISKCDIDSDTRKDNFKVMPSPSWEISFLADGVPVFSLVKVIGSLAGEEFRVWKGEARHQAVHIFVTL